MGGAADDDPNQLDYEGCSFARADHFSFEVRDIDNEFMSVDFLPIYFLEIVLLTWANIEYFNIP